MSRRAYLATLLAVGCFGERTSSTDCPEGEPGCPCAPSGCDPGLECEESVDLCIPENCIPGSELCTCNEGLCLTGLVCDGKLCRAGEGSETATPTSDASSSTLVTTSGDAATSSSTTEMTSGSDACRACIQDRNAPDGLCAVAFQTCAANPACMDLAACIEGCAAEGDQNCIAACCTMSGAQAEEYAGLGSCHENTCGEECSSLSLFCPS